MTADLKMSKASDVLKNPSNAATSDSFLDAFWNISNSDHAVRNKACADIITHCYNCEDGTMNKKDAEYALTRLLRGVCGGKSGVRQGFASTLTSFIQARNVCFSESNEVAADGESVSCKDAIYVRTKLLKCTEAEKGATKLEIRGSAFGRLFAILAILRSGTFEINDPAEENHRTDLVFKYCTDLIDLYHFKRWMRESAAFAICEVLTAISHSTLKELLDNDNENEDKKKLKRFLSNDNSKIDPEKIAIQLHLATLLKINVTELVNLNELSDACFATHTEHPRIHLLFEKIVDGIQTSDELFEAFSKHVLTPLAKGSIDRKATSLYLYQRLIILVLEEQENNEKSFTRFEEFVANESVLKLLFSSNEKHTLSKISHSIRENLFTIISNHSAQSRFAATFYPYMGGKSFIKTFFSGMDSKNKVTFLKNHVNVKDLFSFSKVDKDEHIQTFILEKLIKEVEKDEDDGLISKLLSFLSDLLTNPNTAELFFPKVNSLLFPTNKKKSFQDISSKLDLVLKIYNKFADAEFEEDLDFENLTDLAQFSSELLCSESDSNKLLRHFVRLNWIDAVKKSECIDATVISAICELIGCDDDKEMSDDEENDYSSTSEDDDTNLANLSLVDDSENDDDDSHEKSVSSEKSIGDDKEDEDIAAMEVEHDESADSALASMLELKNSLRKKGQVNIARENYNNQIRCTMFLEIILNHSKSIAIDQTALMRILALYRKTEKGLKDLNELVEATRFLEKLATIFTQLSKLKSHIDVTSTETYDLDSIANVIIKAKTTQFSKICSSIIIFIHRSKLASEEDMCSMFERLVGYWSQNRGPDLAVIFEDFTRFDEVNEKTLIKPLINASEVGRSDFVKTESFSLINKVLKDSSSTENYVYIVNSCTAFLNGEPKKSQHIVASLKLLEKCFQCVAKREDCDAVWEAVQSKGLEKILDGTVNKNSKTQSIMSRVNSLKVDITAGLLAYQERQSAKKTPEKSSTKTSSSNKKSKKKKSKKKK